MEAQLLEALVALDAAAGSRRTAGAPVPDVRPLLSELDRLMRALPCALRATLAWLEGRVRSTPVTAEPQLAESPAAIGKLNATERRHRVLSLARHGQDSGMIATVLGMPRGEVELILDLFRAA